MPLRVSVDASKFVGELQDIQKKSLPFALADALTATAKDAQLEGRRGLSSKFTLRNRFTEQGIRITPADKNKTPIQADVHTDTANKQSGAPDYLGRQETGGEKVPFGGRPHIAIPTRYLRQMAPGVIPQELRPRNLLASATNGTYQHRTRKGVTVDRNVRLVRGFEFFIQAMKDGNSAIMGRYFTDRDAFPFYLLVSAVNVKPRLDMEKDVRRTAFARFPRQWELAWRRIMERGIRV